MKLVTEVIWVFQQFSRKPQRRNLHWQPSIWRGFPQNTTNFQQQQKMSSSIGPGGLYGELPYKVADPSLADFGRKEYDIAAYEMPGLMNCRSEFGPSQLCKFLSFVLLFFPISRSFFSLFNSLFVQSKDQLTL